MTVTLWHRIWAIDWLLSTAIFFLVTLGLAILYGISINTESQSLFLKQLAVAVVGFLVYFSISNLNYRIWMMYSKALYVIAALSLLVVLVAGVTIRGTTGWLSLGFATFQPVEFAKIGLIIMLAKYFSDHGRQFFLWRHILTSGALTAAYVVLVLLQPDFGSAIVILGTWFLMLMVVGVPRKHLAVLVTVFLVIAAIAWAFVLKDYQRDRILTFLNPQADVLGVGYNVRQSVIAVGSGRFIGRGFGLGSQSQLKFLPEPETDFVFAVLAEEFGFIGVLILFAGFGALMYRLFRVAHQTADNFAAFFCLGLAALFTVQTFINIGMNIGIAPVTGIPLPFISSGGSSLLGLFIAFGIVSSIIVDNRTLRTG